MEIKFQGQYTRILLIRALALANKPRPFWRGVSQALQVAVIVLILIATLSLFRSVAPLQARLIPWLATIFLLAYLRVSAFIVPFLSVDRLWKNPAMRAPISGQVNKEGVSYKSSENRRTYTWDHLAQLRKSKDLMVMLTDEGVLSIYPREFFTSDEDWKRFGEMATSKVKDVR